MTLNFHLAVAIVAFLLFSTMPGFSNWKKWLYSADTFRPLKWQLARVSPVLILVATVLWLLRRFSLWEHIKHLGTTTVPWKLDVYLILWWVVVVAITFSPYREDPPSCFPWIALFVVLQIAQTNFYHEFWRTIYQQSPTEKKLAENVVAENVVTENVMAENVVAENVVAENVVTENVVTENVVAENKPSDVEKSNAEEHSIGVFLRLRNFILAFSSLAMVTWLFGLFYWWKRHGLFEVEPKSVWDAIYFSFVTGSTLGYGDLHPSLDGGLIQAVVVFQIVVSLFLVVALLGQCVSGVGVLPQLRHDDPGPL